MRVLLLGGGGREHAIGWKLSQSPLLTELVSCPGNPGLASLGDLEPEIDPIDPDAVVDLARRRSIDLVVIGPEAPLAAGVADALSQAGIAVFGPTAAGARLESSKEFAKLVMDSAGVPTARYRSFTDRAEAITYLESYDGPYVVKADGLAAGKGVLVTEDRGSATAWVEDCLGGRFGEAGATVVIEDHLAGDEVSVFFICAGGGALGLETARDYKRLLDGDEGPNTGGMGSFSPAGAEVDDLVAWTRDRVALPVLAALADGGVEYTGFLYVGLILTGDGPKVLEFNCRLGDPETQALMPRLESDLLAVLHAAASEGTLPAELSWSPKAAVNVVMAAPGYPDAPEKGLAVIGVDRVAEALVFHAGTTWADDRLVTSGGRVFSVVGIADTVEDAREDAYSAAHVIQFKGVQMRTDIANMKVRQ